ncbi:MAG TPA: YceI family protein [Solirubrobacteraceae bacterium]|jgi:polyisoprenoid-binding protein YceI|nr:YceI family protein [Solirubrobacteraceae bacterium]
MSTETVTAPLSQLAPIPRAGDWQVDPAQSRVHFHTRAMFGLFPVHGRFEQFGGVLHVDAEGRAKGELRIEAGSIRTGIAKRDAHLRTDDFFHAEEAPHVVFDLDSLEQGRDGYEVGGTLQIRDARLPIHAHATVEPADAKLKISARFPIDHDAAGLGWAKPGMVRKVIDADVELTLVRSEHAA